MATIEPSATDLAINGWMTATTNPVVEVLVRRRDTHSRPGRRTDGATVALVIEGGGMRGVVAGGMVTALEQLNLGEAFDLVVGTSAGALAGAYFLAGQARLGTSIYYEDLIGKEWLNYRRVLEKRPPLALDYLLSRVMIEKKPLDTEAILASDIPLHAVAATWPDLSRKVFKNFKSSDELRTALHASARIPVATGPPVRVGTDLVVDGSYTESIPLHAALESSPRPTHLLTLLTRPHGASRARMSLGQRLVLYPLMNLMLPGLSRATASRPQRYADELQHLEQLGSPGSDPVALAVQLPPHDVLVKQLEQDPNVLFAGARAGAAAVYLAVTGKVPTFYRGLDVA